jgi:Galactose oxidase, central domain
MGKLSGTPGINDVGVYDTISITTAHGALSASLQPFSITITAPVKGALLTPRTRHTSTLLPNGNVLVAGGIGNYDNYNYLTTTELYDPVTGFFTSSGGMIAGRWAHTATLLPTGKVLIVGGQVYGVGITASCELYDPATGTFTSTGSLSVPRYLHTATLLPNGKVLIAGGNLASNIAELYDPATGDFTATGSLNTGSINHTAVLMPDGSSSQEDSPTTTHWLGLSAITRLRELLLRSAV